MTALRWLAFVSACACVVVGVAVMERIAKIMTTTELIAFVGGPVMILLFVSFVMWCQYNKF